jgi:hypothetical protein
VAGITTTSKLEVLRGSGFLVRRQKSRQLSSLAAAGSDIFCMKQPSFQFVALLLFGVLLSMANAETPTVATSGIQGVILVSPSHPGPIRKDDMAASAPVVKMSFDVLKAEQKVASFTTDAEGHFQISLSPGHYVISRNDPEAGIGHWLFEADVVAGEMAKVRWAADSGMR